jgi:antitoxin (DNA-binding transcriptional repressor) of toxin-antitoxin stability system
VKFVSIRDLRSDTAGLRRDLQVDREIVVTANGKPIAIMTRVGPDNVEEEIRAIRSARTRAALGRMRTAAAARGLDRLPMGEIDAIVARTRRQRKAGP